MNTLLERIKTTLSDKNIDKYLLRETITSSEELFFVKKNLSMTRNKDVTKVDVTLYREFTADCNDSDNNNIHKNDNTYTTDNANDAAINDSSKKFLGSFNFVADQTITDEELSSKIDAAYKATLAVKNPYYELAKPENNDTVNVADEDFVDDVTTKTSSNNNMSITGSDIANMLYKYDTDKEAFINSLEIFVTTTKNRIVNSEGLDVTYASTKYSGEYVVQCTTKEDVELYQDFAYSDSDKDIETSLADVLTKNLKAVADRSVATPVSDIKDFGYSSIILEGSSVYELFSYFTNRLDASMIYPGYSDYKVGATISEGTVFSLETMPRIPYSNEGISLDKHLLIDNNNITATTGDLRYSYYLGTPAIGSYSSFKLDGKRCNVYEPSNSCNNSSNKYLRILNFSDFQMDSFTGQFGGEYRLAYYFDGTREIPVTNGSISDNINEILNNISFSKENLTNYNYSGPTAIKYSCK